MHLRWLFQNHASLVSLKWSHLMTQWLDRRLTSCVLETNELVQISTADSEYAEHAVPPCSIAALKHSNINPLSLSWFCFIVQIPETLFEGMCWCDMRPVSSVFDSAQRASVHTTRAQLRASETNQWRLWSQAAPVSGFEYYHHLQWLSDPSSVCNNLNIFPINKVGQLPKMLQSSYFRQ